MPLSLLLRARYRVRLVGLVCIGAALVSLQARVLPRLQANRESLALVKPLLGSLEAGCSGLATAFLKCSFTGSSAHIAAVTGPVPRACLPTTCGHYGHLAYLNGDYVAAVAHFQAALSTNRRAVWALELGRAYWSLDAPGAALAAWRDNKITASHLIPIAYHLLQSGNLPAAQDWAMMAIHLQPNNLRPRVLLAETWAGQGDWARAADAYARALSPEIQWDDEVVHYQALIAYAQALRELAKADGQAGDETGRAVRLALALEVARSASASSADRPGRTLFLIGQVLLDQGAYAAAASNFNQVIEREPGNSTAFLYLGYALYMEDQVAALEAFTQAMHLDSSGSALQRACQFLALQSTDNLLPACAVAPGRTQ